MEDFFKELNKAPRILEFDDEMYILLKEEHLVIVDKEEVLITPTDKGYACYKKMKEVIENLRDKDDS